MGTGKWRELLQWENTNRIGKLLGKWVRPANNAHCQEGRRQFELRGNNSQHHTAFRVSKRRSPFHLSQVLGRAKPPTTIKPCKLFRLYTLVFTRCAWCLEWTSLPFFVRIFFLVLYKIGYIIVICCIGKSQEKDCFRYS